MPKLADIPQLPTPHYEIDVHWRYIEQSLASWAELPGGVNLDPPYQRAHVWTPEQQIRYVEYILQGGEVGKAITWNCIDWDRLPTKAAIELVDGKQRLHAAREFMAGRLPAFGHTLPEYEDRAHLRGHLGGFKFRVCSLPTEAEVLRLYLNINAGGTPHTAAELDKVRGMLAALK